MIIGKKLTGKDIFGAEGNLNHLKADAGYLQCSKCGRKTYSGMVNSDCKMPQPSGETCKGIFK